MSRILKLCKSSMFLAFLGIVFMSVFIWFAGPLIGYNGRAPLDSTFSRFLAIAGLSSIWFLSLIFRFIKSRRKNAQLLSSIAEEVSPVDTAASEEQAILQSKMQEAVDTLKSRNFSKKSGSRYLYELPWYVIIGPPGAGKTTLLSNSGLDFPLEDTHGKFSVKGIGGTRNCDWWFTDQAVLLDTAGRYTTQDSEATVDKSAWDSFLNLLKEKRSRRPINGVLLALSIEDVLQANEDVLAQIAKTLRTRIDELYTQLGVSPPVYLMFTKCDLLAGFSEYFAEMDRQERNQVWGVTLSLDDPDGVETINAELEKLIAHVHSQCTEKMHRELSIQNREAIYSFPMQLKFAQSRINYLTQNLMTQSRLLEKILFRGVYFTSATQSGSVLDQVIQTVSQSFGIDQKIELNNAEDGKSFFINQLLSDVIFGESGLAGTNFKTERKLKYLQYGCAGIIGSLFLGLIALWGTGYTKNRNAVERIEIASKAFSRSVETLAPDNLDLLAVNSMLNDALALQFQETTSNQGKPSFLFRRTGFYQGKKMDNFAEKKYKDLLIDALLPRLMVRLEHQMHAQSNNSEFLFEALKTYQMIGDREHFNTDALVGWFNFDFDRNLPGDTPVSTRDSLRGHVIELFKERPYRLPRSLDQSLIRQYQQIAGDLPMEERAYLRIRNSAQANVNSNFKISSFAPEASLVFTRSDDVSLDQSIPLFFTKKGYKESFIPASNNISQTLADDAWVLGDYSRTSDLALETDRLRQLVENQYFTEYIEYWESLILSLSLKPVDGIKQASEFVSLITDFDSPLKKMLVLIGQQTLLIDKPLIEENDTTTGNSTDRESQLAGVLGDSADATVQLIDKPDDPVTLHFAPLHALVENWETNASRLDAVLNQLADVNLQLLPMAQSPSGTIDPKLGTDLAIALQKLSTKSGRIPEPMASLVKGISNDIQDAVGGGFCQQLSSAWKTDVYAYYRRAISSRYPVNRSGTTDIALSDFGAFFGHGGVVDSFVNTYLSALVSKTPGQWTWVGTASSVCLSDNSLKQLAFAEDIKNTFFTQGGNIPSFRFDIVPNRLTMSADITQLSLDIGGSQLQYFHGPINGATSFTWPSTSNNTQVSLRVEPVVPGSSSNIALSGPWAILRLLDQGSKTRKSNGVTVDYSFSGRPVSLTWATSSFNPLNSVAVRNFRAPENL